MGRGLTGRLLGVLLLGAATGACSMVHVRGGTSVSDDEARAFIVRRTFRPLYCVDNRGQSVRGLEEERLLIVPSGAGADTLVIRRPGHDAWLVDEAFRTGAEHVYQLSVEGGAEGALLRDIRLTEDGGRMAVASRWTEAREGGRVRAYFSHAQLSCELALSTGAVR